MSTDDNNTTNSSPDGVDARPDAASGEDAREVAEREEAPPAAVAQPEAPEPAPPEPAPPEHAPPEHAPPEHAPPEHAAADAPEHAAADAPEPGNAAPAAETAARAPEPYPEEEPGDNVGNRTRSRSIPDDIGNRLPGGGGGGGPRPPRASESADAAAAGDSPAKKRRRRRRRGKGAGAPGAEGAEAPEQAEGAEGTEGTEGAESAEAGEGAEGDEAQADGEGAPEGEEGAGKKRDRKRRPPPLRERPAFSVGEEVFGKVSKVTDHAIWIDIAGKATGLFDRREILDEEPPVEGDQFIATVASTGVRGGMLLMSRAPAHLEQARQRVEAASETGEYIDGFVTGAVKGGLEVDIGGLRAFAPASHVDLHHGANLEYLVGQRLEFQVTQYAKKGRDIVVSRRKLLEDVAWAERAELLAKIEPNSVHKGIVRTVMAWGVFVALPDVSNVEGLVHMSEASHDRGAKLLELFRPGQEIDVKVMRVDEKGKLWLSHKATIEDPWAAVKEKYAVGSRHKGKVARLQPFGAFIELEPGIDGLIHTADLSLKLISHPSDVVKVGEDIDVVVASCDSNMHRIGLHPAPPAGEEEEPRQKLAPHKAVNVVVHQITEGGLVVRVLGMTGRQSRAFIPAGHTGTQRGTDLRKHFPIGTRLEAKVIDIDPRRGEAKLSIRALKEDAEKQAFQQYRAGVAREAKFGTFADLMKKN